MTVDTSPKALKDYIDAGWQLIPLHSHDYFDQHKGSRRARGKSPLDNNWTKKIYKNSDQVRHLEAGNNVGVRLRAVDLVLDVDPRNFKDGDDPLKRLCEDTSMNLDSFPHVITGSGGDHFYMTKPDNVSVRDSLEGYPGLEFKTFGRQVVSAGSIHPDSKTTYDWDPFNPNLSNISPAPERLLLIIKRPSYSSASTGGGEYDQTEVASMLDVLDPENFGDYEDWLTLMMACHHASNGNARNEFVEWSTRDPKYSGDDVSIGRKWDSLHSTRKDGPSVTHKTLLKAVVDSGNESAIPRVLAADDFEEPPDMSSLPEEANIPEHERKGPIEKMNDKYVAVMYSNKFRIMYQELDTDARPQRLAWRAISAYDFHQLLANKKVQQGDKTIQLSEAWMSSGKRRSAEQVIFDPENDYPNCLNLWTGWAVEPVKGDWSILQEMLFEALCDKDQKVYDYILNWSAYMVQKPNSPAEVALCFQGPKGSGKGTFCRALLSLAGRHGMTISNSKQVTGQFNNHLRDCILLFCDEAVNPYDKNGEAMLKAMITEPRIAFEPKGVDVRMGLNRLHLVMASNEDWFIPMGLEGERRFMLQKVNNSWQGDFKRFEALNKQLENGGLSAMLFDLLNRDIKDWAPRQNVPTTAASVDQKIRGLSPVAQWWFNVLYNGEPPGEVADDSEWWMEPVRIFRSDVQQSFKEYCHHCGIKAGSSSRGLEMMFGKELKKLVPNVKPKVRHMVPDHRLDIKSHSDGRAWAIELPDLAYCRREMERLLGGKQDW